jgi:TonB family protein
VRGEGLPDLWMPRPRGARAAGLAAAIAVGFHALLAVAVVAVDPQRYLADKPIEIDIEEKLPPPEIKPPPEEKPPPEPPRPRIAKRIPTLAPPTPPPPSAEPPPNADDPPPSFGVSLNATTSGDSSVAVAVGNTLMTKPGPKVEKPKPLAGDGEGGGFAPVADIYISQHAELISAPSGEENYPPEAKRLGIEGAVRVKLGIDEKGIVVQVKVVERAGHGFDEAAMRAMRQAKFKPAMTSDGRAVPCNIIWTYRFETDH